MRRKLALWICPALRAEIADLQTGNTKCVLENGKLMDEVAAYRIERVQGTVAQWMDQPDVKDALHRRPATLSQ